MIRSRMRMEVAKAVFGRVRWRAGVAVALAWLAAFGLAPADEPVPVGYTVGTPWVGPEGVRETTGDIMLREIRLRGVRRPMKIRPRLRPHFVDLQRNPDSSDAVSWPQADEPPPPPGSVAQTLGVSFLAATLFDTLSFPPDSMGAAGPTQYILAVNGRIRSFNKQTGLADGVINADSDVFFNSVMTPPVTDNFTTDPRIRYDRLSGRWFVLIIDVPGRAGTLPNRVLLAVSDGPVITAGTVWTFFQFRHDQVATTGDANKFADYPTLGVDANALYIGVNVFGTRGIFGSFDNTTAFVIRKSSVLGGGPIVVTAFRKLIPNGNAGGPYTPQGVDNFDPAATEGYFIGVNSRFYGRLELRRVSNPGGTPSLSGNVTITIPLNGGTVSVPHLGNTGGGNGELDGIDYRLMNAVLRNGRLWTCGNMAVNNTGSPSGTDTRMAVRWYELSGIASGQTPNVVQSGTLFQSSASNTSDQRSYWMGSIMVSGQGHAALGFSVSGALERANAGTAGRLAQDSLGTMRTPMLYTASTAAYNPPGDSGSSRGRRWGDYSYTCVDPNDDMTMWTIQQWCNAANSYGVQVVKLIAPPPATPSACSPSSVTQGVANVNVTLTGTAVDGSGFFDPGVGFSNRLAAGVNGGGVTVNGISYSNPTNLILNLTVAPAAATGARTITVTNPDNQSATSAAGILTISPGVVTNNPPVLVAISDQTIDEQSTLVFTNSATDPDAGQTLTFSLDAGAPVGASIDPASGVFTWTPTEAQGPGTNTITVRVTDNGSPPLSDARTFMVVVNEVNAAPSLAAISDRIDDESSTLTFTNTASDPDIPANLLSYSLDPGAPVGASVDPASGVFTWTPTEAQGPSTNTITVRVTDNGSPPLSDTKTFLVVVNEVNSAPALTAIADEEIHAGLTLVITNVATDPDIPPNTLIFSLDAGAPAGASINANDGVLTWTPAADQIGTNLITVRVTDDGAPALSGARSFAVVVAPPPVFQLISLSGDEITLVWSAIAGTTYRVQFSEDLGGTEWTDLAPDVIASGATATKTDSISAAARRFYRVMVVP